VRVTRKDLASKCIPRYDDAKDKLGAIVTAPTLFQRLAKHFQDVAREFGTLVEKQHSVVRMLTSPSRGIEPPPTRPASDMVWCDDSKRPRRGETPFGRQQASNA